MKFLGWLGTGREKWIKIGVIVLVILGGIGGISYLYYTNTHNTDIENTIEYKDIGWKELTK